MLKKILAFILTITLLFGTCACGMKPSQTLQPSNSENMPTPTPDKEVTISDFTVIYPSDEIFGLAARESAVKLATAMMTSLSVKSLAYSDEIDSENGIIENTYEILVGDTGRSESEKAVEGLNLRYYDYIVKYIGTKLVIRGGSNEALSNAVDYVINNVLDESITTAEGFKSVMMLDYEYTYKSNISKFTINGISASKFKVVSNSDASTVNQFIEDILKLTGEKVSKGSQTSKKEFEILLGECDREEYRQVEAKLGEYDYAIEVVNNKLVIAAKTDFMLEVAINKFVEDYLNMNCDEFDFNENNNYYYEDKYEDLIITIDGVTLRDPCVLLHDGVYYMYGTWWQCYKNTTGNLHSGWEKVQGDVVVFPEDAYTDYWAPEVHEYKGKFYMFTTYRSSKNEKRGCAIFRADSPEGPFELISDGHVTPNDRNCIDGTLYVDEEGQAWMVFVLEWVDTNMGGMACAKLSDDLTHFICDPIELFDADAPKWATSNVTDGPWLYRCEDGSLIMIWSNFSNNGYSVGIAHSDNGLVTGTWVQDDEVFFPVGNHIKYDGGHGMLFKDIDGNLWMSIHSPNTAKDDRTETPVFVPVKEENGTLVFDDCER